jgi:lipoprotein-releasing system permease protein
MNTSFLIASRYLISKKSHNLINIISSISVLGLTIGTFALIVVLSVFNGFEDIIKSLYGAFNPDFEISIADGKTFEIDELPCEKILSTEGVKGYSSIVEEDALFKYGDKQYIGKIKGVDKNYIALSGVDSMLVDGYFVLQEGDVNFAVVGSGVAWYLNIIPDNISRLLTVYVPKRGNSSSFNLNNAFNQKTIHPAGVFSFQQEFDEQYIFLPLQFVKDLMDYQNQITSVEIFVEDNTDGDLIQKQLETLVGNEFVVKNRFQQNMALFKVMNSEKMAIFFILIFILALASFNMIGSLSILIVEKTKDIAVLKSMGADKKLIKRIFTIEGVLISTIGGIAGLVLGFLVLFLQQKFGLVKLGAEDGDFIINAYPVKMIWTEFAYVFAIVQIIGYLATLYPVNFLLKNYNKVKLK